MSSGMVCTNGMDQQQQPPTQQLPLCLQQLEDIERLLQDFNQLLSSPRAVHSTNNADAVKTRAVSHHERRKKCAYQLMEQHVSPVHLPTSPAAATAGRIFYAFMAYVLLPCIVLPAQSFLQVFKRGRMALKFEVLSTHI